VVQAEHFYGLVFSHASLSYKMAVLWFLSSARFQNSRASFPGNMAGSFGSGGGNSVSFDDNFFRTQGTAISTSATFHSCQLRGTTDATIFVPRSVAQAVIACKMAV